MLLSSVFDRREHFETRVEFAVLGAALLAAGGWSYRWKVLEVITAARVLIGTSLIIVGVGIIVAKGPEMISYAARFSPSSSNVPVFERDTELEAALRADELLIGCAAMMIAGGWFFRQSARRQ